MRRIAASTVFSGSDRLIRFLEFVVSETLAGNPVKESNIGVEVFGRQPGYDTKVEPIVRVQARRLRTKLDEYYTATPDDPLRIELPKGTYVPRFEATPPAAAAHRYGWIAAIASGVVLIALVGWLMVRPPRSLKVQLSGTRPLANDPGYQSSPAFSPDGQTVAFAWDGGVTGASMHVYVQRVDADSPHRLTNAAEPEDRPVFAPDGDRVALVREKPGGTFDLVAVPTAGTGEHRFGTLRGDPAAPPRIDWSPDGRFLYATEQGRVLRVSLESGRRETLTSPQAGTIGDSEVAISPDGSQVAFRRSREAAVDDILVMPSAGGAPQPVTHDGAGIVGFAWSSDGRGLIVSSRRASSLQRLWFFPASGGAPVQLTDAALAASWPTVCRRTGRVAYASRFFDANVWRVDLGGGSPPQRLLASNVLDSGAQYSHSGRWIAFRSNRTGSDEVWLADQAAGVYRRLTHFEGPVSGSAQWSPDDHTLAIDSRPSGNADIFLVDVESSSLRRFTDAASNEVLPRFSRDGQWVYFASDRTGSWQIWKQPLSGGAGVQVTRNGGFACYESDNGQWLYYSKGATQPGLWRMPVKGGDESVVLSEFPGPMWGDWAVANGTLYTVVSNPRSALEAHDLRSGSKRQVALLAHPPVQWDTGLGVSADGRSALVTQVERAGSAIYLATLDSSR